MKTANVELLNSITSLHRSDRPTQILKDLNLDPSHLAPVIPNPGSHTRVECFYANVYVDTVATTKHKDQLVSLITEEGLDQLLVNSCNLVQLAGAVGNSAVALRLMAVGYVLRWWQIITPANFGVGGAAADEYAKQLVGLLVTQPAW